MSKEDIRANELSIDRLLSELNRLNLIAENFYRVYGDHIFLERAGEKLINALSLAKRAINHGESPKQITNFIEHLKYIRRMSLKNRYEIHKAMKTWAVINDSVAVEMIECLDRLIRISAEFRGVSLIDLHSADITVNDLLVAEEDLSKPAELQRPATKVVAAKPVAEKPTATKPLAERPSNARPPIAKPPAEKPTPKQLPDVEVIPNEYLNAPIPEAVDFPQDFTHAKQQLPGPVEFDILSNKLVVLPARYISTPKTMMVTKSALDLLRRSAKDIGKAIASRNFGHTVRDQFDLLMEELNGDNIFAIGILHANFMTIFEHHIEEAPTHIISLVDAFNRSMNSYLSQFDEWVEFVSRPVLPICTPQTIANITTAARRVVTLLANAEILVDRKVPESIGWVIKSIDGMEDNNPRILYALIRTMYNFAVKSTEHLDNISNKILGVSRQDLKDNLLRAMPISHVSALYESAVASASVLIHIPLPELRWIKHGSVPLLSNVKKFLEVAE